MVVAHTNSKKGVRALCHLVIQCCVCACVRLPVPDVGRAVEETGATDPGGRGRWEASCWGAVNTIEKREYHLNRDGHGQGGGAGTMVLLRGPGGGCVLPVVTKKRRWLEKAAV